MYPNFNLSCGSVPIEWGVYRFPDGQIQFWADPIGGESYRLECSIIDSEGLDLFVQIINTLALLEVVVKYLYGARSDKDRSGRLMVANLPRIICKAIKASANPDTACKYVFWNPHCELYIEHQVVVPIPVHLQMMLPEFDAVLYPDESAFRRLNSPLRLLNTQLDLPAIFCEKERDQITGRIISHEVPSVGDFKRILVADDLCDGGATFLSIAEKLPGVELHLYVTHGIFSNGAKEKLLQRYKTVWSTDSYPAEGLK